MHTQGFILTDAQTSINIEDFSLDSSRIAPQCPVPWSVHKKRLRGGKQEGVDLIELRAGELLLRLVPTRGMAILDATYGQVRLGWDSPVKEVVHPLYIDPHNRGSLGWLEGFNEYLVRCGLEWFGGPTSDSHHHAQGEAPASNLTLHGKIANTPASRVELQIQTVPPYQIKITGLVRERSVFGPKLDLISELTVVPGERSFTVKDQIHNDGAGEEEFGLLYHLNHGKPLLEEGACLLAPVARVTPMTHRATEGGVERYAAYGPPTYGYTEQNYMLELLADKAGRTQVMLRNRAKNKAVTLSFSKRELPCFTVWKNTQDEKDGYVTGLEPGTNYPFPRPVERIAGRVPKLASGKQFTASITFTLHGTAKEVAAAAGAVQALQGKRKTVYDPVPPTV